MKELRRKVAAILLKEWDPIGIRAEPRAQDEYDDYVDAITKLLIEKRSMQELAAKLFQFETTSMGLPGDTGRAEAVARKLITLRE